MSTILGNSAVSTRCLTAGSFESRTRSGFSARRRRSSSPSEFSFEEKNALMASTYAGRVASVPTELSETESPVNPSRPRKSKSMTSSSASVAASAGAEHLRADLPELAVAALLRALVAELRPDVIELPGPPGLGERVLDVRARDPGRVLGAHRHGAPAAVGERVHLLVDDVGRLADAPHEELGRLQTSASGSRRTRRARRPRVRGCFDAVPDARLGREEVPRPLDARDHRGLAGRRRHARRRAAFSRRPSPAEVFGLVARGSSSSTSSRPSTSSGREVALLLRGVPGPERGRAGSPSRPGRPRRPRRARCAPTSALSRTVAFIPIRAPRRIVQACTTAL